MLPRDLDAFKAPSHLVPQNKTFDTTTSSFNVCVQQSLHILLHLLKTQFFSNHPFAYHLYFILSHIKSFYSRII